MTTRKPDRLKLIDGTYRADRADPSTTGLHALDALPKAPPWMRIRAATEFERIASALHANKLLSDGNVGLLQNYAALLAHLADLWEAGVVPRAAMLSAARSMAVALNLVHVAPTAPPTKENAFAKHKAGRPKV